MNEPWVWVVLAGVLLLAVSAAWALLSRRRRARAAESGFTHTAYDYGDPYAADTYGTNPHGISLGPSSPSTPSRDPDDDEPSERRS